MKHIKLFEDIISWDDEPKSGNRIPSDDKYLVLIEDLTLELKDSGFIVLIKGYYAYHKDHICYDIFINKPGEYEIFDIKSTSDINIDLSPVQEVSTSMKDILSRLMDNGLYLGSHNINVKDNEVYSHSRLFRRIDGDSVKSDFVYT
jgi:hypothetical protein